METEQKPLHLDAILLQIRLATLKREGLLKILPIIKPGKIIIQIRDKTYGIGLNPLGYIIWDYDIEKDSNPDCTTNCKYNLSLDSLEKQLKSQQ